MKIDNSRRKKVITLSLTFIFLSSFIMIFTPGKAKADTPYVGEVWCAKPFEAVRHQGSTSSSMDYMKENDEIFSNSNPAGNSDSKYIRILASNFNDGASKDLMSGTFYDTFGHNATIPSDATVTAAMVYADGKTSEGVGMWPLNEGWFSIFYAPDHFYDATSWWDTIPSNTYYTNIKYTFNQSYEHWTNSSAIIPYGFENVGGVNAVHAWNITGLFNISQLTSTKFAICWNQPKNLTGQYFDYLGMSYTFTWGIYIPGTEVDEDFQTNFDSIMWLLVIYLPVIAMTFAIPKLGYLAGMGIMMLVCGYAFAGFYPVMLVGLLNIGIVAYKGG